MNYTNFADQSSGIGALGVNLQALIIQLITFLIVLWVLKKWAFKPILKVLSDRRKLIESGVNLGNEMKKKEQELEEERKKILHEAQANADKLISDSKDEAKDIISKSEDDAKNRATSILEDANKQIDENTKRSKKKLEKELYGLISEATEAIIGEKIDETKDAKIIDNVLKGQSA
ncbi:MAG: F0F1 ATP synthase subunit B [bacterium]|jgi:F-type H+-transporting ATPase subunit b